MDCLNPKLAVEAGARPSIFDLIFSPGQFFTAVNNRPSCWITGFVIAISLALTTFVVAMPLNRSVSANLLQEHHIAQTAALDHALRIAEYASFVGAPIGVAVGLLVSNGILWILATVLSAHDVSFKKLFAVVSYAWIIIGVDHVGGFAVNYFAPNWRQIGTALELRSTFLSVGSFVDLSGHPVWLSLANACSLFSLWYWMLLVVGVATVARLKKSQAVVTVFGLIVCTLSLAILSGFLTRIPRP